jgi:hypothetical protein
MSFGGFLGIGEKYHPLPWHMLTYDTRLGGYVVDLDRDKLENAPSYASTESPNWSDRSYTDRIDQYWRKDRTAGLANDETDRLISPDKVEGTSVYNPKGERLGKVRHLMIDKYTGEVAYAVMSFGGFLGIGEKYNPLPWKMLTYDTRLGGYVVDLDRNKLENAPSYASTEPPDLVRPIAHDANRRVLAGDLLILRASRGWWTPTPAAGRLHPSRRCPKARNGRSRSQNDLDDCQHRHRQDGHRKFPISSTKRSGIGSLSRGL